MFLGILIGMVLFGIVLIAANADASKHDYRFGVMLCVIGLFSILIGFCGAVGWIIEILV